MDFKEVVKLLLVSFDSTIRTNLSVGLPIDYCDIINNEFKINEALESRKIINILIIFQYMGINVKKCS